MYIDWSGHKNLGDDAMRKILMDTLGDTGEWDIFGGGTAISPHGEFYEQIKNPEKTIGISLGVAESWNGQYKELLEKLHKIYVRDYYSFYKLREYGIKTTLSVDLLCHLEPTEELGKGKRFANLIHLGEGRTPYFDDTITKIYEDIKSKDYEMFALSPDHDLWIMNGAKVYTDAQELSNQLNGAEHIIATRLHANVLAWTTNSKVTPIIYDAKVKHFYERVANLTPREAKHIIDKHLNEIINEIS